MVQKEEQTSRKFP